MRILILSPVYPSAASPAEGVFIKNHAEALAQRGVTVTVMVCKPWLPAWFAQRWHRYKHLERLQIESGENVSVRVIRHLQFPAYRMLARTIASCARAVLGEVQRGDLTPGYDLIHAQSAYPVGLAAPILADALGVPFVVTLHIQDDPELYEPAQGHWLYERMLDNAAAVVAVGSPLERFVRKLLPTNAHTRVTRIPNGVETERIGALNSVVHTTGDCAHIVSVGNLWKIKGLDYVLKALAELDRAGLRGWHYTIVGGGPERNALEQLASELGLANRVHFAGALAHDQAIGEIAAADIFALPSWNEAFGVVYLEAMACGKPVIGCQGQGAEDMVVDQVTGILVKPKDVPSLAQALRFLIENLERARAMGRCGKERCKQFTWRENARRYIELYEQVCSCVESDPMNQSTFA